MLAARLRLTITLANRAVNGGRQDCGYGSGQVVRCKAPISVPPMLPQSHARRGVIGSRQNSDDESDARKETGRLHSCHPAQHEQQTVEASTWRRDESCSKRGHEKAEAERRQNSKTRQQGAWTRRASRRARQSDPDALQRPGRRIVARSPWHRDWLNRSGTTGQSVENDLSDN